MWSLSGFQRQTAPIVKGLGDALTTLKEGHNCPLLSIYTYNKISYRKQIATAYQYSPGSNVMSMRIGPQNFAPCDPVIRVRERGVTLKRCFSPSLVAVQTLVVAVCHRA